MYIHNELAKSKVDRLRSQGWHVISLSFGVASLVKRTEAGSEYKHINLDDGSWLGRR